MDEMTAFEHSSRLVRLLARERQCMTEFICALAEFHQREGFRALGFTSLFHFLTRHLHLANASAWRRATAAELVGRFALAGDMLRDGRLTLRSLTKLREVLTEANHAEVLARAAGLSEQAAELLACEYRPRPIPRETTSTVRTLQTAASAPPAARTPAAAVSAAPVGRPRIEPLTPALRRLHVNISAELERKLEVARGLLSHKIPNGDFDQIMQAALDVLIEREQKRKAALTDRPRQTAKMAARQRRRDGGYIPAAVRRAVWKRDNGCCAYLMADDQLCGSTTRVQFDHDLEKSLGGPPTLENVRLLCWAHHRLKTEEHLGRSFVARFRSRGKRCTTAAPASQPPLPGVESEPPRRPP